MFLILKFQIAALSFAVTKDELDASPKSMKSQAGFLALLRLLRLLRPWDARIRWCKDAVAFLALPKSRTALICIRCHTEIEKVKGADDHGPLRLCMTEVFRNT